MSINTMVSVIVATYKRDNELLRALESLADQNFKDLEIVVVDDNGNGEWNQKVQNVIDDFTCRWPEISLKYIKNEANKGSAESRNVGIFSAIGEYITFLDDDDIYLPEKIQNQYIAMKEANADFSVTDLELCNEDYKTVEIRTRSYVKDTSPEMLFKYHLMHHLTGTDTIMFKRDYLLKIGCFPPIDIGDEFYLIQRAIEGNGKFIYVPVCDVKAFVHSGKTGLSSGEGKINGENRLFEYKKQYFTKLDKKSIRYIKMRHFAVLAFAYLRMKRWVKCFKCGVLAMINSPINCLKLIFAKER